MAQFNEINEDVYTVGAREYMSDVEVASSNLLNKIKSRLDNASKNCYEARIYLADNCSTGFSFDKYTYRKNILKLVNNKDSLSQVLDFIYKDYRGDNYISSNSRVNRFVESYIKVHKRLICANLDINVFKNISYYNKYYKLYTLALVMQNKRKERIANRISKLNDRISYRYNRFYKLTIDEYDVSSTDSDEDEQLDTVAKRLKQRKKIWDDLTSFVDHQQKSIRVEPVRNRNLLYKLQYIIYLLGEFRKRKSYRCSISFNEFVNFKKQQIDVAEEAMPIEMDELPCFSGSVYRTTVQPEMMDDEQVTQQQEAGPVVLNALQQDEVAETTEFMDNSFWISNSTGDAIVNEKHASSMEMLLTTFKWSSTQVEGTNIFDLSLPIFALAAHPKHPASMLFSQYAYWNGDIKLRVHINTTPFHIGKLIFSWYYSSDFDANSHHRNNIASSVLLPHVNYLAADGGDVVMNIPYRSYRSMLCTRKKLAESKHLNLGNFRCHVFNPLILGSATEVDGYVHISFVNNHFTGIMPRGEIQAEMLPIKSLIKATEGALTTVDKILNMDKPPNPAVPLMYTPQFSDSFASGTNDVNNVHMLRLNPMSQTPHPIGSSTRNEETNIDNIIRKFGLLKCLSWDTTQAAGTKLYTIPVSPELVYTSYYQCDIQQRGGYRVSVLPPVSAIATINAYNRGSLEYEIEVICSRYHTGALAIAFTPCSKDVELESALQSYYMTLDIGAKNNYIFKVPYINERPYNPRFNRDDSNMASPHLSPIGEFNVFVMNALRTVNTVSTKVYVNIYIRAGDDFELAVPVPPLYSVNYDYKEPLVLKKTYPETVKIQSGLASWRYCTSTIGKNVCILKYDNGADEVMQFVGMKPFTIYTPDFKSGVKFADKPYSVSIYRNDKKISSTDISVEPTYIAMVIVNDDHNKYTYATVFSSATSAQEYVSVHKSKASDSNLYPNSPTIEEWVNAYPQTAGMYLAIRDGAEDSYRSLTPPYIGKTFMFKEYYSAIQNEVGDVIVDPSISILPTTSKGLRLFGEQFHDLKDYCRRYQLYGTVSIKENVKFDGVLIRVPITPIGLDLSHTTNGEVMYVTREGMIPYIASAYRFYRGSMRFKILITQTGSDKTLNSNSKCVVYVQHKPDIIPKSRDIQQINLDGSSAASKLLQSGYAYTAMSLDVNNSITVEIPCYIPTNLLLLQKPDFNLKSEILHYMCGMMDILIPSLRTTDKYYMQIHMALADDMDFSCYVGFPPMLNLYSAIQAEGPTETIKDTTSTIKALDLAPEINILTRIKNKAINYKDNVVKQFTCSSIRSTLNLEETSDDSIGQLVKDAIAKLGHDYKDIIISMVSQIVHCINNPTVPTFVIALLTLLTHVTINSLSYVTKFTQWFSALFSNMVQGEADDNKTEISSIDGAKQSIISSIVEMSASTFKDGVTKIKAIQLPNFSEGLFKNVRMGALTVNAVFQMFKNFSVIIPKIITWVGKTLNPMNWIRWLFGDKRDFIEKWVHDVEYITDPNNADKRLEIRYVYHTELLIIAGRDLMLKLDKISKTLNKKYIHDLNVRLNEVYKSMSAFHKGAGSIGIEPFCLCIVGDSQLGKTHATKDIASECLKAINYSSFSEVFYTRPQVSQYWDGCENQPICIYDDFLHMKSEQMASPMIGEFLLLKSKATFQPNRAHLDDKGKKYSPLILCLTMNEAYPDFSSICADPFAWQNRRDVMFKAEFKAPSQYPNAMNANDLPREFLTDYKHLVFKRYMYRSGQAANAATMFQPCLVPKLDENSEFISTADGLQMESKVELSYKQVKWFVMTEFGKKYEVMIAEYLSDLKHAMQFYPATMNEFDVNIDNFVKHLKKVKRVFNEREKHTIDQAEKMLKNVQCQFCNMCIANCACTIEPFQRLGVQQESLEARCVARRNTAIMSDINVIDQVNAFVNDFNKHEFFKTLPSYIKECIVNQFRHYYRLGIFPQEFTSLISKPCFHKLIMMYPDINFLIVDSSVTEDDESSALPDYKILCDNVLYELDNGKCKCIEFANPNCKIMLARVWVADEYLLSKMPSCLKVIDDVVVNKVNQYAKLLEKHKKQFLHSLRTEVHPNTWLGTLASFLSTVKKPLIIILGLIGSVWGLLHLKDDICSRRNRIGEAIASRRKMNEALSMAIQTHEVTEDCLDGKCNVCVVEPHMAYEPRHVVSSNRLKPKQIASKVINRSVQDEMAVEVMNSLDRKLKSNYFYIRATTVDDREVVVRCLGLCNRWFIGIDHYFDHFADLPLGTMYEFCRADYVVQLDMSQVKIQKLHESALCICELPKEFMEFKNIIRLFAPSHVVPNLTSVASLYVPELPEIRRTVNVFSPTWYKQRIIFHPGVLKIPGAVHTDLETHVRSYWSYTTSGKGLCGSLLISDMNITTPLIGMHVAGLREGNCGYSEIITQETFTNFFKSLPSTHVIKDVHDVNVEMGDTTIPFHLDPTMLKSALPGVREFIGCVPKKYTYNPPTKTKVKKSLCYNKITTATYDIPHISHRDERFEGSPMVNGCMHHIDPPLSFPDDIVDIAYEDVRSQILHKVIPLRHVIGELTMNEAIVGIPDIPGYDAMAFDTSEGFPLSSIRPNFAKDKRWLFNLSETEKGYECNGINPILLSIMQNKYDMRSNGIVPPTVFTDCLKDMKLPKEKCHKTRIFSISPVDFTIQFRQLFYDYTIAFQEARFKIESAVGINVDSYEWHNMISMLTENSTRFVCGDYSKFGPRLMNKIVQLCFRIIADWYIENGDLDKMHEQHRLIMGYEIAFSLHLMLNMLYRVYCGAPSGSPITTILNNMVNMFYIRCAYLYIMREQEQHLKTLTAFHQNVKVIFYGDDLIMTVKDCILHLFNATTISNFFSLYNIVFTDALKTGEVQLSTHVFAPETSFLKRTTTVHPSRYIYIPVMDKRAVEETCNWIFEGHDEIDASLTACEAMMLNAHGHGPEYYENLRSRIYQYWKMYDEYPNIPTWKEVDYRMFDGGIF